MRRRAALTWVSGSAVSALSLLLLVACGGGSDSKATSVGTEQRTRSTLEELWRAPGDDVAVVPGTSTYEPGRIRVSFVVLDAEGQSVTLPTARIWLARGLEEHPFLESTAKLERIGVPGGARDDSTHIYVVHVPIRKPGTYWLLAQPEGGPEDVQALGNVVVKDAIDVPAVGDAAPASATPTLSTAGGNAARITTRVPPDLTLLEHSVTDALRAGHPFVVTFATPKFCTSRACGPVVDVVEDVAHRLEGSELRFIHVEVYEHNDPTKGYNRWMQEWGLTTEPWTFVVGADGRIADRFEGPVSVRELEEAAEAVAHG
jgi:hypothetical protein